MTISHCPTADLTPYAREMVVAAMRQRITDAEGRLERLRAQQAKTGVLRYDTRYTLGGTIRIPRRYLIWDSWHMSPYEIIADSLARIDELSRRDAKC